MGGSGQHVDVTQLADVVSEWLLTTVALDAQILNGDEADVWAASYDGQLGSTNWSPLAPG
jgi:hypothetical protein